MNFILVGNAPRRSRRAIANEWQRPLTRYLPVDRDDFDLRRHVESAGNIYIITRDLGAASPASCCC